MGDVKISDPKDENDGARLTKFNVYCSLLVYRSNNLFMVVILDHRESCDCVSEVLKKISVNLKTFVNVS